MLICGMACSWAPAYTSMFDYTIFPRWKLKKIKTDEF